MKIEIKEIKTKQLVTAAISNTKLRIVQLIAAKRYRAFKKNERSK